MKNLREFVLETIGGKRAYMPGDVIRGELFLTLEEPIEMKSVKIFFCGEGAGVWMEQTSVEDNSLIRDTEGRVAKRMLIDVGLLAFGFANDDNKKTDTHKNGRYVYTFEFNIPQGLPPTFKSPAEKDLGYAKYYLKAVMKRPRKYNKVSKLTIVINSLIDPDQPLLQFQPGAHTETNVRTACISNGELNLKSCLNRSYFTQGENILINAVGENDSTKIMKEIYAKLIRRVSCKSAFGTRTFISEEAKVHGGRILSNKKFTWKNHKMRVPPVGPTLAASPPFQISVDYFVRVGMYEDFGNEIHHDLHIVIGTLGQQGGELQHLQPEEIAEGELSKRDKEHYGLQVIKAIDRSNYRKALRNKIILDYDPRHNKGSELMSKDGSADKEKNLSNTKKHNDKMIEDKYLNRYEAKKVIDENKQKKRVAVFENEINIAPSDGELEASVDLLQYEKSEKKKQKKLNSEESEQKKQKTSSMDAQENISNSAIGKSKKSISAEGISSRKRFLTGSTVKSPATKTARSRSASPMRSHTHIPGSSESITVLVKGCTERSRSISPVRSSKKTSVSSESIKTMSKVGKNTSVTTQNANVKDKVVQKGNKHTESKEHIKEQLGFATSNDTSDFKAADLNNGEKKSTKTDHRADRCEDIENISANFISSHVIEEEIDQMRSEDEVQTNMDENACLQILGKEMEAHIKGNFEVESPIIPSVKVDSHAGLSDEEFMRGFESMEQVHKSESPTILRKNMPIRHSNDKYDTGDIEHETTELFPRIMSSIEEESEGQLDSAIERKEIVLIGTRKEVHESNNSSYAKIMSNTDINECSDNKKVKEKSAALPLIIVSMIGRVLGKKKKDEEQQKNSSKETAGSLSCTEDSCKIESVKESDLDKEIKEQKPFDSTGEKTTPDKSVHAELNSEFNTGSILKKRAFNETVSNDEDYKIKCQNGQAKEKGQPNKKESKTSDIDNLKSLVDSQDLYFNENKPNKPSMSVVKDMVEGEKTKPEFPDDISETDKPHGFSKQKNNPPSNLKIPVSLKKSETSEPTQDEVTLISLVVNEDSLEKTHTKSDGDYYKKQGIKTKKVAITNNKKENQQLDKITMNTGKKRQQTLPTKINNGVRRKTIANSKNRNVTKNNEKNKNLKTEFKYLTSTERITKEKLLKSSKTTKTNPALGARTTEQSGCKRKSSEKYIQGPTKPKSAFQQADRDKTITKTKQTESLSGDTPLPLMSKYRSKLDGIRKDSIDSIGNNPEKRYVIGLQKTHYNSPVSTKVIAIDEEKNAVIKPIAENVSIQQTNNYKKLVDIESNTDILKTNREKTLSKMISLPPTNDSQKSLDLRQLQVYERSRSTPNISQNKEVVDRPSADPVEHKRTSKLTSSKYQEVTSNVNNHGKYQNKSVIINPYGQTRFFDNERLLQKSVIKPRQTNNDLYANKPLHKGKSSNKRLLSKSMNDVNIQQQKKGLFESNAILENRYSGIPRYFGRNMANDQEKLQERPSVTSHSTINPNSIGRPKRQIDNISAGKTQQGIIYSPLFEHHLMKSEKSNVLGKEAMDYKILCYDNKGYPVTFLSNRKKIERFLPKKVTSTIPKKTKTKTQKPISSMEPETSAKSLAAISTSQGRPKKGTKLLPSTALNISNLSAEKEYASPHRQQLIMKKSHIIKPPYATDSDNVNNKETKQVKNNIYDTKIHTDLVQWESILRDGTSNTEIALTPVKKNADGEWPSGVTERASNIDKRLIDNMITSSDDNSNPIRSSIISTETAAHCKLTVTNQPHMTNISTASEDTLNKISVQSTPPSNCNDHQVIIDNRVPVAEQRVFGSENQKTIKGILKHTSQRYISKKIPSNITSKNVERLESDIKIHSSIAKPFGDPRAQICVDSRGLILPYVGYIERYDMSRSFEDSQEFDVSSSENTSKTINKSNLALMPPYATETIKVPTSNTNVTNTLKLKPIPSSEQNIQKPSRTYIQEKLIIPTEERICGKDGNTTAFKQLVLPNHPTQTTQVPNANEKLCLPATPKANQNEFQECEFNFHPIEKRVIIPVNYFPILRSTPPSKKKLSLEPKTRPRSVSPERTGTSWLITQRCRSTSPTKSQVSPSRLTQEKLINLVEEKQSRIPKHEYEFDDVAIYKKTSSSNETSKDIADVFDGVKEITSNQYHENSLDVSHDDKVILCGGLEFNTPKNSLISSRTNKQKSNAAPYIKRTLPSPTQHLSLTRIKVKKIPPRSKASPIQSCPDFDFRKTNRLLADQFDKRLNDAYIFREPKTSCGFDGQKAKPLAFYIPADEKQGKFTFPSESAVNSVAITTTSSCNKEKEKKDDEKVVNFLTRYEKKQKQNFLMQQNELRLDYQNKLMRQENRKLIETSDSHSKPKYEEPHSHTTINEQGSSGTENQVIIKRRAPKATIYPSSSMATLPPKAPSWYSDLFSVNDVNCSLQHIPRAVGRKDESFDSFENHEKNLGIIDEHGKLIQKRIHNYSTTNVITKKQRKRNKKSKNCLLGTSAAKLKRSASCPATIGQRVCESGLSDSHTIMISSDADLDEINLCSATTNNGKKTTKDDNCNKSSEETRNNELKTSSSLINSDIDITKGQFGYEEEVIETYQFIEEHPVNKFGDLSQQLH